MITGKAKEPFLKWFKKEKKLECFDEMHVTTQKQMESKVLNIADVVRRFLCWLGFHNWVNINVTPIPNPKAGEMICWSDLHECKHCKKQDYKGMGCVV